MLNMYASLKGLGDVGFFGALLGGGAVGASGKHLGLSWGLLGLFRGALGPFTSAPEEGWAEAALRRQGGDAGRVAGESIICHYSSARRASD